MNVSYDHYRVFYAVARSGSVSAAAERLFNNQPNVTRIIRNLEKEVGCPLFHRTNRGMILTAEGEQLFSHVRVACEQLEMGENELAEFRDLRRGTVSLAVSGVSLRCFLLPILKEFRLRYPDIRLRVSNRNTLGAMSEVRNGIAEFAVVTDPPVNENGFRRTLLRTVATSAVCSPAFSDLLGHAVSWEEVLRFPLISLNRETVFHSYITGFFAGMGLSFQPDVVVDTADQILPMVTSGLGIGFVPDEFFRGEEGVSVLTTETPLPLRSIFLLRREDAPLGVAAKRFEQMVIRNAE